MFRLFEKKKEKKFQSITETVDVDQYELTYHLECFNVTQIRKGDVVIGKFGYSYYPAGDYLNELMNHTSQMVKESVYGDMVVRCSDIKFYTFKKLPSILHQVTYLKEVTDESK